MFATVLRARWIGGRIRRRLRRPWRRGLPRASQVVGVAIIGGIGLGTLWIHLSILDTRPDGSLFFVETIVPTLLSTLLLGTGLWIYWRKSGEIALRVGAWCLVGTVVLLATSLLIVWQAFHGATVTDLLSVVTKQATVGAILGVAIGIRDGQRLERDRALRDERERARAFSNRLTVLSRVLRHDIRNAVTVIRGHASLARDGQTATEMAVKTIDTEARKLYELSERARQLEQLIEGDPMQPTTVDIVPLIRSEIRDVGDAHPRAVVETELPETARVRAIPSIDDALREVLEHAVERADSDTPRLEVTVSTSTTPARRTDDEVVVIRIRDNGPGIREETVTVLEKGRETDLEHLEGIGLWLVYWIVTASNGEIRFPADEAGGRTLELRLESAPSDPLGSATV